MLRRLLILRRPRRRGGDRLLHPTRRSGSAPGPDGQRVGQNAGVSEQRERLFVVDRPAGREWVPGKGAREQPLWPEHAAFMDDLFERGVIALGGPFLDGSGATLVMRVADEDRPSPQAPLVPLLDRREERVQIGV